MSMRRFSRGIRTVAKAVLLVGAVLSSASGLCQSDAQKRERLENLKESIESLKEELEDVKGKRSELLEELEHSEENIGDLSTKVQKLKEKLESQKRELNKLHDRQKELQQEKKDQQDRVGQHINAAYRLGRQSGLRVLLNQQDPARVSRNLKYFDYVVRERADKIRRYNRTLDELSRVETDIAARTERLNRDYATLEHRRRQLVEAQQQRRSTLARLEATIADKDEDLRQKQRDRQRLERLLAEVSQLLEDIKLPADSVDFVELKGRLPWPADGAVIRDFGTERVAGRVRWQGIFIRAEAGTPVRAVHHGRVVFSDYLRGHGLLLIVDHGSGFMTLYAHNQSIYKDIGEWVNAGETIATVGESGGQRHTGLYFELRHNGRPTNPRPWIRAG